MNYPISYKISNKFGLVKNGDICLDIDTMLNNSDELELIIELFERLNFFKYYKLKKFKHLKSNACSFKYKLVLKSKSQENIENSYLIEILEYAKLKLKK